MFSQRVPARYLGHRRPHSIGSCSRFLLGGWRFRLSRTLGARHDREHLGRCRRLALNGLHPHGSGAVRLLCLARHDSQRATAIFVRRRWLSDPGRCLAAGPRAQLPHEGSGLLAFGRELVLRFLFRQQLQKDSAPFRIGRVGRVGKQPSIEPDVLIVDEFFHFPALRSGRHRRHFQLFARQPRRERIWYLLTIAHIQSGQV